MAEMPKVAAYVVALNFGEGGLLHINAALAPSPEAAAAMVTVECLRMFPGNPGTLIGVAVGKLDQGFLEVALSAAKGLPREGGQVLSLVPAAPSEELPRQEAAPADAGWRAEPSPEPEPPAAA